MDDLDFPTFPGGRALQGEDQWVTPQLPAQFRCTAQASEVTHGHTQGLPPRQDNVSSLAPALLRSNPPAWSWPLSAYTGPSMAFCVSSTSPESGTEAPW